MIYVVIWIRNYQIENIIYYRWINFDKYVIYSIHGYMFVYPNFKHTHILKHTRTQKELFPFENNPDFSEIKP